MKITIEPTQDQSHSSPEATHSTVAIGTPSDDLDIDGIMDLMRAALLAWGFAEATVNEVIPSR